MILCRLSIKMYFLEENELFPKEIIVVTIIDIVSLIQNKP